MIQHRIMLDTLLCQHKPDNQEIKKINNRIIKHQVDLDIVAFSKQVTSPNGRTWIPAYLEGARKTESWKSQSIFALDFDTGLDFNQVFQRLEDYGLSCTFAYSTFSDSIEKPKFRLIWQLNQVVIDRKYRTEIHSALERLFPEADKACKDPSRMFFGGKELIYTNYDYVLALDLLFEAAQFHEVRNSSNKNISRDLKRVRQKLGLIRNGSEYNTSYINNIETAELASKLDKRQIEVIRGIDFEKLRQEVKILDDFMNPAIKLLHPQLLGLATNLRYIEGGQSLFERCITENPDYSQLEKLKIMAYCKSNNYYPMSLDKFSPYKEDWEYGTLLYAAKKKEIIRLENRETMSVEQSRQEMKDSFTNIYKSDDTNIHVIKAVTGIGKTKLYEELEAVLIAMPTHFLKNEVANERMRIKHRQTPSLDNLPKEIRDKLNYYYSIGAFSWANQYLSDASEVHESVRQYQDECLACYASDNTILTTHQKGIFISSWIHKTIIFDEDMIGSLMPIGKVTMNDLLRLEANISNINDKRTLSSLINDIREGRVNTPRSMDVSIFENFSAIEDEVLDSSVKYESNILHFFDAKYYVVDSQDVATIHYIRKYDLPTDKKIIVLSATADEKIYTHLFGDRLKFYDMSNVRMTGLIEQETKYSLSKSSLSKHLDYAMEKVDSLPVITFAKFKSEFLNPVEEMHFGNCSGSDKYNGQDIAVVGTPHVSPITIALYAKALGVPFNAHEFSRVRQQSIYHNGFRFWFNTYDNEHLRNIQFYFIESGLKQAIGRARPYTAPSRVKVLSNYPLQESCIGLEELKLGRERLALARKAHLDQCLAASMSEVNIACDHVS